MSESRKYEQSKRAEQVAGTRRRIVEATVDLHRTVGPAATRITEVARRAGVQRVTVYNHFPEDGALFAACSQHWRQLHPAPDLAALPAAGDPVERVRAALVELYGWFRETAPMTANVLRDMEHLPSLRAVVENGLGRYLEAAQRLLAEPFDLRGGRRRRLDAALSVAVSFPTWQQLEALGDAEAAELAAGLVALAAAPTPGSSGSRGRAGSRSGSRSRRR